MTFETGSVYSKSQNMQLNLLPLDESYIETSYNEATDEYPEGKWRPVPIATTKGHKSGGYLYEIVTPSGKKHTRKWAYPEYSYKKLLEKGRVYFGKNKDGIPQRVIYSHESTGIPASNIWVDGATNKEGKKEILDYFADNAFDTPKPTSLIIKILQLGTFKDSIVIDSFAGSGTTAEAVMNLNKLDGGDRKFILVEMEDEVAKDVTAERVKRAIQKYDYQDGFEYCELDKPLFDEDGQIEKNCDFYQFATYIYFTETQSNIDPNKIHGNFIGELDNTEYYLIYKEKNKNDLNKTFLHKLKKDGSKKIVYADRCLVDEDELREYNVVFKQIPYEVKVY